MRRYVKPTRARQSSGRTSERADPTVGMGPRERARWDRLRAWRTETAKTDGVPAYVIFHDATLAEMARRPGTIEDLRGIPGIGARKLDRFGEELSWHEAHVRLRPACPAAGCACKCCEAASVLATRR